MRDTAKELGALPMGVWAATLLFLGTALFGTFLDPIFRIPDERFHVDMIFAVDGDGYPEPNQRDLSPAVEAAGRLMLRDQRVTDPLPPRGDIAYNPCDPAVRPVPVCTVQPTFHDLGTAYRFIGPPNRMATHPPAYYVLADSVVGALSTLWATDVPFRTEVWFYRLVSLALAATMPVLAGLGARELGLGRSAMAVSAMAMPAVTGLVLRNAPIVNNDNLVMVLLTGALVVLARIARHGPTTGRAIAVGVLLGLGLLTKGFSLVVAAVLPLVLFLLLSSRLPRRDRLITTMRSTALMAGSAFLAGGWWVVRNIVRYGTPSKTGPYVLPPATEPVSDSVLEWAAVFYSQVLRSALQKPADAILNNPLLGLALLIVLVGLLVLGIRMIGWRISFALALPMIATLGLLSVRFYGSYLNFGEVVASHGRYYFPTMLGVVLVAAAGVEWLQRRWERPAVAALPTLAILTWTVWATIAEATWELRATWSPDWSVTSGIDRMSTWAPAPNWIAVLGICVAAVGVGGVALAAIDDFRRAQPATTDATFEMVSHTA